jgi:hypothetical protein
MKFLQTFLFFLNILVGVIAFTPCITSSSHDVIVLNLHPDQAPELEEAAKQWLDAASKLDEEQDYFKKSQSNRVLGTPLSASGSMSKSNQPPSLWWSRAFNRLVRRNNTRR